MAFMAALSTAAAFTPTKDANMNPGKYLLQATPGQSLPINWSTNFADYPGGVEYFEVALGPVTSVYSEVFWKALPPVTLPPDLIKRFAGKGMAIIGFEADQVRHTADGDVSVPINVAYNHHYGAMLLGAGSHMESVPVSALENDPRFAGNATERFMHPGPDPGMAEVAVEHAPSTTGLPTSMLFGYSNGGEFRKTYHALARPFAHVIESPEVVHVTPMQIDTWNRDEMSLTGSKFVAGPAPKRSLAPVTGPDAVYSGLLECPLTTRLRKHVTTPWNGTNATQLNDCAATNPAAPRACAAGRALNTSAACFAAARALPGLAPAARAALRTSTGSSTTMPAGCSLSLDAATGAATAYFNANAASDACCGAGVDAVAGAADASHADVPVTVNLTLSLSEGATIALSGPAAAWFGVGFDAVAMANSPYAIIVDGNGAVTERVLGNHDPGALLAPGHLTLVSSAVNASTGRRTVVLKRALQGATPQYHSFDARKTSLSFIAAVGSTKELSYHKARTTGTLALWPTAGAPACVCSVPGAPFSFGQGTFEYVGGLGENETLSGPVIGETIGFPRRCGAATGPAAPGGVTNAALAESALGNRNPTCDLRTYVGGLSTCHHGWKLLDADQDVPWQDQQLEYFMKFRLYYQEYDPTGGKGGGPTHVPVEDITWSIAGSVGEYDVPVCAPGTPAAQCTHTITGTVVAPFAENGDPLHFVAAHYHCHAPTCLSQEIRWGNATGELLCKETPYHGGQGALGPSGKKYDEEGYIAQRICLWGLEPPFEPPPMVSGKTLWVKAVTNNTYGHHGEMALPQMLLAALPKGA